MNQPHPDQDLQKLIHWHPYQRKWLADKSRFKIGMFTRQGGKSMVACGECVEDCIDAEISGKRTRWVILSRGERQAKLVMDEYVKPMTRAFWELYRGLLKGPAPEVEEEKYRYTKEDGTDAEYTAHTVRYPGGSWITAIPANPDTARGFSANMLFDEFAFHQNSKAIWGAAFPVISKGWKARVISTPNGKSNKFYELMTETPSIWSRHQVDIYEAVAQGLDRDIDELRAGLGDDDLFAQEYELQWRDEASAWLDYDLITSCETEGYGQLREIEYTNNILTKDTVSGVTPPPPRGPVYVGMDIARKVDLTCIWTAELIGDVLYPREIITMRRAPFRAQHEQLQRIDKADRPIRFALDQTGMGEPFVERAKEYLGDSRCEGVIFSPPVRFAMASKLKDKMEDRKLRVVVGNRSLRDDLHSITKRVAENGAVRLVHDGESDGHGDRFWAAALIVSAADETGALYQYHSVAKSGRSGKRPNHSDDFAGRRRFGDGAW